MQENSLEIIKKTHKCLKNTKTKHKSTNHWEVTIKKHTPTKSIWKMNKKKQTKQPHMITNQMACRSHRDTCSDLPHSYTHILHWSWHCVRTYCRSRSRLLAGFLSCFTYTWRHSRRKPAGPEASRCRSQQRIFVKKQRHLLVTAAETVEELSPISESDIVQTRQF